MKDNLRDVNAAAGPAQQPVSAAEFSLLRILAERDFGRSAVDSLGAWHIVSVSWDDIEIWDADNGILLRTFTGHDGQIVSASYSPDGRRIVSASFDNTIKIWDAESGALLRTLAGHFGCVWSADYSPDGQRIVSASQDGKVRIWDAESGALLRTLSEYNRPVYSASYSPDGRHIVSALEDGTIKIWDAVL
jgi:WD40 repeat protein